MALLRRRFLPRSGSVDWTALEEEVTGLSTVDAMILVIVSHVLDVAWWWMVSDRRNRVDNVEAK